ncbi:MAG: ABC transporter ATP-binding protein [Propionibacteriaceae bacterium]|jgi:ABC-2 type transport system ATP-binding protein|nr:ABC transporter ATP-binding protein [Propionibacteriaceae bacterium]
MAVEVVRVEHLVKSFTLRKQKSVKESLLNASRARTTNETFQALADVSCSINAGESVGLVGPNGSGKSTLLKIIGGILTPNQGRVQVRGRVAALLELGAGFHPDLSGRENIFLNASVLGVSRSEAQRYFNDIVEFSGIPDFIDTQVKFYSSGMYVRLAFSVAVHVDPDVLLVDEVLAVGDEPFQQKCMDKIRQFQHEGRTIVFVSHAPGQVADLCDRAILLEKGRVVVDDVPLIALGRLRRDYQRVIEANKESNETEHSAYQASIDSVYLTSEQPSYHHSEFQVVSPPGLTLCVNLELTFAQPVSGWSLQASIETTLGNHCLSVNTRDFLDAPLPTGSGTHKCVLRFPDLQLGEGDYVVNLALHDERDIRLDAINRAGLFAIRTNGHSSGPVYSDPTIDFDPV